MPAGAWSDVIWTHFPYYKVTGRKAETWSDSSVAYAQPDASQWEMKTDIPAWLSQGSGHNAHMGKSLEEVDWSGGWQTTWYMNITCRLMAYPLWQITDPATINKCLGVTVWADPPSVTPGGRQSHGPGVK